MVPPVTPVDIESVGAVDGLVASGEIVVQPDSLYREIPVSAGSMLYVQVELIPYYYY